MFKNNSNSSYTNSNILSNTVKPVYHGHTQNDRKLFFNTNYRLMLVKSIAKCQREHSAILLTFIKLPVVIKTFVLSIFEWPFYTGFTIFL